MDIKEYAQIKMALYFVKVELVGKCYTGTGPKNQITNISLADLDFVKYALNKANDFGWHHFINTGEILDMGESYHELTHLVKIAESNIKV